MRRLPSIALAIACVAVQRSGAHLKKRRTQPATPEALPSANFITPGLNVTA